MEKRVQIKRRTKRKKVCLFCADKVQVLDYKDTLRFKRFITERGKIYPRRNSGLCAKHQRVLSNAVKRARYIGLVPYTVS
jgi:small subunit ribosomal protein S18